MSLAGALSGGITGAYYGSSWGWVGGVVGFVIGAVVGAVVGEAMTPDMPTPGTPDPDENVMKSTVGDPIKDLAGTAKIMGHLLLFGKERNEKVYSESGGGKGGGGGGQQVSGYKYYMSWAVGICAGEIDTLYAVYKNDDVVWEGELDCPVSGGEETITLDGVGSLTFYFGTDDQVANTKVGEIITETTGDATLNSPLRNMCWAFFDDCYIGEYNRTPTFKFIVKKIPANAFNTKDTIQAFDCNPMHVLWYIFNGLSGLPETWLNDTNFSSAADTLYNEYRGISVLFDRQQTALSYIESINSHIDNIIRYGNDSEFHPKLIRDDYTVGDLQTIDETVMLGEPSFNRKSWIDTLNEVKVQYSEIIDATASQDLVETQGQWVAAISQPNTDYVYLYDLSLKAIIKIKVANPPLLYGILEIDNLYSLDYGKGYNGADKGAHCVNKTGDRLWYLFRTGNDCQLVEINISGNTMRLVKKTSFSSLLSGDELMGACATDDYVYFCTNLVTGRIIKFGTDHSLIDNHLFTLNKFSATTYRQGITQMDVRQSTGDLFWNYVLEGWSGTNATAVYVRSSSSFAIEEAVVENGLGTGTPWSQNLLEIHEDYVLQQRVYYPSTGPLYCWNTTGDGSSPDYNYVEKDSTNQDYMQSILGVHNNKLFTLWYYNGQTNIKLGCIDFPTLGSRTETYVGSYLDTYNGPIAAAINNGIVVLNKWDGSKNNLTCFGADSSLTYLCTTAIDKIYSVR